MDIADIPASSSQAAHLLPTTQHIQAHADVAVERVIGDSAFGSSELRAACAS
jgi:hypothetical protein